MARLAAVAAALLVAADEADAHLADAFSVRAGDSPAVAASASAATAQTTSFGRAAIRVAQAGPPIYPGGSLNGLFSRGGLLGGFAAGFLGSGLLGLLFGRSMFGELGGVPSYLGLLFQLALLSLLCRLIWSRWHGGDRAGSAGLSPRQLADPYLRSRDDLHAGLDSSAGHADDDEATRKRPARHRSEVTDANGAPD
jgi:hypothetical protein